MSYPDVLKEWSSSEYAKLVGKNRRFGDDGISYNKNEYPPGGKAKFLGHPQSINPLQGKNGVQALGIGDRNYGAYELTPDMEERNWWVKADVDTGYVTVNGTEYGRSKKTVYHPDRPDYALCSVGTGLLEVDRGTGDVVNSWDSYENGSFNDVRAVYDFMEPDSYFWLTDREDQLCVKIDRDGVVQKQFGELETSGSDLSHLHDPKGCVQDPHCVYICDEKNMRVLRVDTSDMTVIDLLPYYLPNRISHNRRPAWVGVGSTATTRSPPVLTSRLGAIVSFWDEPADGISAGVTENTFVKMYTTAHHNAYSITRPVHTRRPLSWEGFYDFTVSAGSTYSPIHPVMCYGGKLSLQATLDQDFTLHIYTANKTGRGLHVDADNPWWEYDTVDGAANDKVKEILTSRAFIYGVTLENRGGSEGSGRVNFSVAPG